MTNDDAARPVLITLKWVPEFARGLVRDLRVRWALEEAAIPYRVELVDADEKMLPAYRALQPFGQVPAYRDGALRLFESGAIVHHIAAASPVLMPADAAARSRTLSWMFAALNSVEPALLALADVDLSAAAAGASLRRPALLAQAQTRLADLNRVLEGRAYLLGGFTAADILMASVLNIVRHTPLVAAYPHLHAYHQRCRARPAARKAHADQMALYEGAWRGETEIR
ncbi:glutathione S-transferase family protein [Massilia sp. PWRC2]|uniref:glutathione S-transferase family protein n=1 Tax=Massilia sp. PWRC2 TaxID=2804626 RepID=UPI003CE89DAC